MVKRYCKIEMALGKIADLLDFRGERERERERVRDRQIDSQTDNCESKTIRQTKYLTNYSI